MHMRWANASNTTERGGFTLVELLVVISIIGILALLLAPMANRSREAAKGVSCLSCMRQINEALSLYIAEHNGSLPNRTTASAKKWPQILSEDYLHENKTYACPVDSHNWIRKNYDPIDNSANRTSYILNGFNEFDTYNNAEVGVRIFQIPEPSRTILLGEAAPDDGNFYMDLVEGNQSSIVDTSRHHGGANYIFCDGSARWIKSSDYSGDMWKVDPDYTPPPQP